MMVTPVSSIATVFAGSFVGSFYAVFLKAGAQVLTKDWRSMRAYLNLAAGVAIFAISSVFFVHGIRNGELSILYPLVSFGYVWTMLWARLFFKEPLTPSKIGGVGLILAGIVLLGLGNR
jgi:drug/metabolite transporter (DMT)-like permease